MKTTKLVEVDGAMLAADVESNKGAGGVPILFLHANVADRRMWDGQWQYLVTRHPVVSYDRRGFGESRTLRPTSYSNVSDLWAVMDRLELEQAVLVGCSMGGRIAIDAALARPDRVASLVLVSPGVSGAPAPEHGEPVKALMDAIGVAAARGDLDTKNELQAQLWLDGPLSPPCRVQGEARRLFLAMNGTALRAESPGVASEEPSAWDRLEAVKPPTLVMWGDLDLPHLQQRSELLAQRIPKAQSVVLPGTAHLPALESPQQFQRALGPFLENGK
ncbi:alpha/beta fold hydrolase [Variovorax ginsengisoli]|uniref:Pimeloyl-ACP methyl ester carboxylesterase n=1 Tax=Variovorax ginsengisoli TaxID=363844 RepID=A0ABT9SG66_9BURK|nr:alpha/beta hydrolase [Variovorax ginsengisoli]MDP9902362.1 pimeloyl-ACP methyl ester carboxylesterase [Variovorax ginsengisoli]